MFKFLRRLFGWFTLVSLMFWAGVAWYVVQVQPVTPVPTGYPATVAACKAQWAQTLKYQEVREQAGKECDRYYALLGDRTAPFIARLKEQVITRLISLILVEYMEKHPPQPGQSVGGKDIVDALGIKRIAELLMHVVTHAQDPYTIADKAEARCRLDEVRRVQALYDLAMVPVNCQRQR